MNPLALPREAEEGVQLGGHANPRESREVKGPIERFSHLVLGSTDLDRSEAWYRDVIGLDILGRNLTAEERPHSLLKMNTGQLLILVLVSPEELYIPKRTGVHHGFMLTPNQYRRAYDRMKKAGYNIGDEREQFRAHGEFSMDIDDPDGHRFQIQCYGLESKERMPGDGVIDCGLPENYRLGAAKAFKVGNFYLFHHKEGFLAISRWCRHLNGIVVYQPTHWHFMCPFHGATYDNCGVDEPFTSNKAGAALHLHPISFSPEGHLLVNTDEIIEGSKNNLLHAVQPPKVYAAVASA